MEAGPTFPQASKMRQTAYAIIAKKKRVETSQPIKLAMRLSIAYLPKSAPSAPVYAAAPATAVSTTTDAGLVPWHLPVTLVLTR